MAEPASSSSPVDLGSLLDHERATAAARRRRVILASVVAPLLIVGAWLLTPGGADDTRYLTTEVTKGPLVVTVNATGTLQPTNHVDVGSELSGILESVFVDFNDRVSKGQVLARLDTSRFSAEALQSKALLSVAEATLVEKRASVVESQAELRRLTTLRKASGGRAPSQQDIDAATAALARAKASVASSEAQIDQARAKRDFDAANLARAEIRSPIDGVVLTRDVEPGQTIASSFQAPKLFQLAEDLAQMELEVDVDEADVGQVREGQSASFTVDSYPDRTFPARITQLRYASETVNGVVTYKAVLQVANADLALRPGMTATADIVVATLEGAVLVPNEALRFVPPETRRDERGLLQRLLPMGRRYSRDPPPSDPVRGDNRRTVYRLAAGRPESVEIHVGLTDGRLTQVIGEEIEVGTELIVDVAKAGSS
ncbi:MAG: efflux RND transporter periplasmic adaptor subunit [Candidatus Binatia bacterium]